MRIRKGGGDMIKTQDMQLYYVVLLSFKKAKLQGRGNDAAFTEAKAALVDYFVSAPNVNKQSFSMLWEEMKKREFTQQLNLDFQLIQQQKKTALALRGSL
jgi:hypothetical protein